MSEPHTWEPTDKYRETYEHPLWKDYQAKGVRGGHDGMDYLVFRAFVESVKNGTGVPIDIYDAAAWMAVTCLSEESIALGGAPVAIPDFTAAAGSTASTPTPAPTTCRPFPTFPAYNRRKRPENNRRADCAVQSVPPIVLLFRWPQNGQQIVRLAVQQPFQARLADASAMQAGENMQARPRTAANFLLRSGGECCIMCEHRMHMPV